MISLHCLGKKSHGSKERCTHYYPATRSGCWTPYDNFAAHAWCPLLPFFKLAQIHTRLLGAHYASACAYCWPARPKVCHCSFTLEAIQNQDSINLLINLRHILLSISVKFKERKIKIGKRSEPGS